MRAAHARFVRRNDLAGDPVMTALALADDFTFAELYDPVGLTRLDTRFLEWLATRDAELASRLHAARGEPEALDAIALSQFLVELAPAVEHFITRLFGIEKEAAELTRAHDALGPLYQCKRLFVQRRAAKKIKADVAETLDASALETALEGLLGGPVTELGFATAVMGWLANEEANASALETALQFAAWAAQSAAGKRRFAAGMPVQDTEQAGLRGPRAGREARGGWHGRLPPARARPARARRLRA